MIRRLIQLLIVASVLGLILSFLHSNVAAGIGWSVALVGWVGIYHLMHVLACVVEARITEVLVAKGIAPASEDAP